MARSRCCTLLASRCVCCGAPSHGPPRMWLRIWDPPRMRAGDEVRTIQLAAGSACSSCLGWIAGDEGVNVCGGFGGGLGTSLEAAPLPPNTHRVLQLLQDGFSFPGNSPGKGLGTLFCQRPPLGAAPICPAWGSLIRGTPSKSMEEGRWRWDTYPGRDRASIVWASAADQASPRQQPRGDSSQSVPPPSRLRKPIEWPGA